ncbi:CKLF-like MARVEL transmembrane domain-containing protein 8b [Polymixia lowei]
MEGTAGVSVRSSPAVPDNKLSTSTLAFDQHFTTSPQGMLLLVEIVCGVLVWILVGGTDYFHVSALGWVMFVAILYWVLTICLFIIYLSGAHNRIANVPWTTLSLCFNSSATVLYLTAAVVDASSVSQAIKGRHNYNCWAASAFFAFLTTLCYAGSSYLSYQAWRMKAEEK